MNVLLLVILCFVQFVSGVINRLTEKEYSELPPFYYLDNYQQCIGQEGGVFCSVDFSLVADAESKLLDKIKQYSENTVTHFNHTNPYYGICLTKTCLPYHEKNPEDPITALEGCLNETFWKDYRLKTRVNNISRTLCMKDEKGFKIDGGDIFIAVVFLAILLANVVGSVSYAYNKINGKQGSKFLDCFSIQRNWSKLVAPAESEKRLGGLDGLRVLTTTFVILGHSLLLMFNYVDNTLFVEESYHSLTFQMIYNGTLFVQTFFLISGFLLAANCPAYLARRDLPLLALPKNILKRWLRLTPAYAAVLALTATWLRFAGSGPSWQYVLNNEIEDCRSSWFLNLFYINNFFTGAFCMGHTWYIAAEFQLHCLLIALFVLVRGARGKTAAVGALVVIGAAVPGVITYLYDLDAVLLVSPGLIRNFFTSDPTYNMIYRPFYTNMISFVLGVVLAFLVHHLQSKQFDITKYKKYSYKFFYWGMWPNMSGLVTLCGFVYMDELRAPALATALFAAALKPVYGGMLMIVILGLIFKYEGLYRGILEWRGWTAACRASYGAYLLHCAAVRLHGATETTLKRASLFHLLQVALGLTVTTWVAAVPFWLLLEAPADRLVKTYVTPRLSAPPLAGSQPVDTKEETAH